MRYYCEEANEVLKQLDSREQGLDSKEAAARLEEQGKNRLQEAEGESLLHKFLGQLTDPMILILIVAALISGVLAAFQPGESFADVIIILFVVLVNGILGVYQENKAEKAIEALQEMAAATSKVWRDGKLQTIPSEDLVVGDVISLEAGDMVAADCRLLESASLQAEEAALTGESVPVTKWTDRISLSEGEGEVPLGDRKNMLYMGSTVAYGRGVGVVTATGMDTEMGKIAEVLRKAEDEETPLQRKLNQLSKTLTWLVLVICVVVFAVQLARAGRWDFPLVLNSFMVAVSLAVAAIPEGLAAVVTVVLSIGVTNMAKRNAIIRRLTAVETLGCAQIICSDKTGTLTQNRMTVVDSYGGNTTLLATAMALCNDAQMDEAGAVEGEPTEAALVAWAKQQQLSKHDLERQLVRVGEVPFDSARKLMSTVHQREKGFVQFTKGAPDVLVERCEYLFKNGILVPMTEQDRQEIARVNKQMADKALRVLACAQREYEMLPKQMEAEALEQELCFIGLCGMIDPIRPEVSAAIVECREAGIRPIMITGDHVDTAVAIAKELGMMGEGDKAITGAKLQEMSEEAFEKEFQKISVYARVQPEHKTRIVRAWRNAGYVTAMTGDGVNDAPSIKAADIGVGMGVTGTDVTKNVADMVLADDNFATIVGAVEEGRRIYDNIRKSIQFLLGSNLSEVLSIFFATILGFTILKPVHLLWINLVTDCFPALALGMEKAEPDIMRRKPREAKIGIFSDGLGVDVIYQGILVAVLTLASYVVGHFLETGVWAITDSDHGMTMAFLTLSMAEIFHSMNMRSQRKSIFSLKSHNMLLFGAAVASLFATTVVCEVPFLANAFGFTKVGWFEYVVAMGIGFLVIPVVEVVKWIQKRD